MASQGVRNRRIGFTPHVNLSAEVRHYCETVSPLSRLCKQEVTGSIPVGSIGLRLIRLPVTEEAKMTESPKIEGPAPGVSENAPEVLDPPDSDAWEAFLRVGRVLLFGIAGWLVLAFALVPVGIRLAYHIDILVFSDLMTGRATIPVSEYLRAWQAVASRISSFVAWSAVYIVAVAALSAFATTDDRSPRLGRGWTTVLFQPLGVVAALCLVAVIVVSVIHRSFPVTYAYLVVEDGWIEQASFLCWFTIPFLLGWRAPAGRRLGIIAFAIVGFVFAMEEISWGQRLLGFQTPAAISAINDQDELNLHNIKIFYGATNLWKAMALGILGWTFLLPAMFRLFPKLRMLAVRLGVPMVPRYLWPGAIAAAYFLLFHARIRGHEIGEGGAAVFCVAVALAVIFESTRGARSPGPRESIGLAALLALVLGLGVLTGSANIANMRYGLNSIAVKYSSARMYEQAHDVLEHIEAHPEYRLAITALHHADVLGSLGRHAEAREALERELEAKTERTAGRDLRAGDHRVIGEVLSRLAREDEAVQAFRRALELDHAALSEALADQRYLIHWSLARTYDLLGDMAAVASQMRDALETPSARDRKRMKDWLQESLSRVSSQ